MDKFIALLKESGLEAQATDILTFLVRSGQTTIAEIAAGTSLKRSTAYFYLDQLVEKKLVKFIKKGARRYYSATPFPEMRKLFLEQQESAARRVREFESLLPELSLLAPRTPDKPRLTYFEGRAGVQTIFEDMLLANQGPIMYVGSPALFEDIVGQAYLKKFVSQRIARKIRSKAIWSWPHGGHAYKPGEESLREARYAPEGFMAPMGVFIYADRVSLLSEAREGFGTIVESRDFYVTMRNWFESLWPICGLKPSL